jgi:hypothetical protein
MLFNSPDLSIRCGSDHDEPLNVITLPSSSIAAQNVSDVQDRSIGWPTVCRCA